MRKAREVTGMSQAEFGAVTGISRRSITSYEGGERMPRRPQLIAWAMASGVPLTWLEQGVENPRPGDPDGGGVLPRLDSNQQPFGYTLAQVTSLPDRRADAAPATTERLKRAA